MVNEKNINHDILILTETMVNEESTRRIISSLGFCNYDFILLNYHVWRIWLLWKDENVGHNIITKEH